jgi:parallel beta-helix repeat protein
MNVRKSLSSVHSLFSHGAVKGRSRRLARDRRLGGAESLESRAMLATFVVTNVSPLVADPGSLPWAVDQANTNTNPDEVDVIEFRINGGSVPVISLIQPLQNIIEPVKIDGTTQPGYRNGFIVEVDGSGVGFDPGAAGFTFSPGSNDPDTGASSTIKGLSIYGFQFSPNDLTDVSSPGVSGFATGDFSPYGVAVLVEAGVDGVSILDCYIGTNPDATAAGNDVAGVLVKGTNTTIRGNVIANNGVADLGGAGIILDVDTGTTIAGNRIGVDATGGVSLPNNGYGIYAKESMLLTIGGYRAVDRNVIAGNTADGLRLKAVKGDIDAPNLFVGNYVGVDATGAIAVANGNSGIVVDGDAVNIGDGTAAGRNIISGNDGNGILVLGGVDSSIRGNFIGSSASGTGLLGNGLDGIRVDGGSATSLGAGLSIGGILPLQGNLIGSNAGSGIRIASEVSDVVVQQNLIGVDVSLAQLGNGVDGITIDGAFGNTVTYSNRIAFNAGAGVRLTGADGNWIGADASRPEDEQGLAFGNAIYGNGAEGVLVDAGSDGNIIAANVVGRTSANGAIVGNIGTGIAIVASAGNEVGGVLGGPVYGNVVAGNAVGISITSAAAPDAASGNVVRGNLVQNNLGHGIVVDDSSNQTIGGATALDANTVTLNADNGIEVSNGSRGIVVSGNYVGTDAVAVGAGNGGIGIRVLQSSGTLVGGGRDFGNVVVGNASDGVVITRQDDAGDTSGTASGNLVQGNVIRANAGSGLRITAAGGNQVGDVDADYGNQVVGNKLDGLRIESAADGNLVIGNTFGAAPALGNGGVGVRITSSAENVIGTAAEGAGNLIARNAGGGVLIEQAIATDVANGNVVDGNTVVSNLRSGVLLTASAFQTIRSNSIGTNAAETTTAGNVGYGIDVVSGYGNVLAANTVAFNQLAGIRVSGIGDSAVGNMIGGVDAADGNTVQGNRRGGILVDAQAAGTTILNTLVKSNVGVGITIQGLAIDTTVGAGTTVIQSTLDGILVTGIATGTSIVGAYVGTDASDTTGLGNQAAGVRLSAASGVEVGAGTLVARNKLSGIRIEKSLAADYSAGNVVKGATIRDNLASGIIVTNSTYQTIGGTVEGDGNTISSNLSDGVMITGGSRFVLVQGGEVSGNARNGISVYNANDVTVSDGVEARENAVDGISFYGTSTRGAVTDSFAAANRQDGVSLLGVNGISLTGNLVDTNGRNGVSIGSAVAGGAGGGNSLYGNEIIANTRNGVSVLGSRYQVIGGTGVNTGGNTIGQNGLDGIYVGSGSSAVAIAGNFIGTDALGADLGNANDGIEVNASAGVSITANASRFNAFNGLRVTGVKGTTAMPTLIRSNTFSDNRTSGVLVNASLSTQVGGLGYGNVIGGNVLAGVRVGGASSATTVEANYIGTDEFGDDLGNIGDGVQIAGSAGNVVRAGNTIRFNGTGVRILDISVAGLAQGNRVESNLISENDGDGVVVAGGVNHTIGGGGVGNTITLNGGNGVSVIPSSRAASSKIVVRGNFIGTDASQVPLGNASDGVKIVGGSGNTVDGNTISDSGGFGVSVAASSTNVIGSNTVGQGNTLAFNRGGVLISDFNGAASVTTRGNSVVGNEIAGTIGDGVTVTGARTVATAIGAGTVNGVLKGLGNSIHDSTGVAVLVAGGAQQVSIQANSIYDNAGGAIFLFDGTNAGRAAPTLARAEVLYPSRAAAQVSVTGTLGGAVVGQQYQIDVYSSRPEDGVPGPARTGTLYGGRTFLGRMNVTSSSVNTRNGVLTFAVQVPAAGAVLGDYITVMSTNLRPPAGTSSVFSAARELTLQGGA